MPSPCQAYDQGSWHVGTIYPPSPFVDKSVCAFVNARGEAQVASVNYSVLQRPAGPYALEGQTSDNGALIVPANAVKASDSALDFGHTGSPICSVAETWGEYFGEACHYPSWNDLGQPEARVSEPGQPWYFLVNPGERL